MQDLFELLFREIIFESIVNLGRFIRWCISSFITKIRGHKPVPFTRYTKRKDRDRDPSNQMSNGIIDAVLGFATIFAIGFMLIQSLE